MARTCSALSTVTLALTEIKVPLLLGTVCRCSLGSQLWTCSLLIAVTTASRGLSAAPMIFKVMVCGSSHRCSFTKLMRAPSRIVGGETECTEWRLFAKKGQACLGPRVCHLA